MINIEHIIYVLFAIPFFGLIACLFLKGNDHDIRYCASNIGLLCYSFIIFVCCCYFILTQTFLLNKSQILIHDIFCVLFICINSIAFIICILLNKESLDQITFSKTNINSSATILFKKKICILLLMSCFINSLIFSDNLLYNFILFETCFLLFFLFLQHNIKYKKLFLSCFIFTSCLFLFLIAFIDHKIGSVSIYFFKTYPFSFYDKILIYSLLFLIISLRTGGINFFHVKNIRTSNTDENIIFYSVIALLHFCFVIKILNVMSLPNIISNTFSWILFANIFITCCAFLIRKYITENIHELKHNKLQPDNNLNKQWLNHDLHSNKNEANLKQKSFATPQTSSSYNVTSQSEITTNSTWKQKLKINIKSHSYSPNLTEKTFNYNSYSFVIYFSLLCLFLCYLDIHLILKNFFLLIIYSMIFIINFEIFNYQFTPDKLHKTNTKNIFLQYKHNIILFNCFCFFLMFCSCLLCPLLFIFKILIVKSILITCLIFIIFAFHFSNVIKNIFNNIIFSQEILISNQRLYCLCILCVINIILFFMQFIFFFEQITMT